MTTECSTEKLVFGNLNGRKVEGDFGAGRVSSDGGGLLLREVDKNLRLTERLAACFADFRDPELVEHTVVELIKQRVYSLALGYEDLSDHDSLGRDILMATLVGKSDPTGGSRRSAEDRGQALASSSTLGRLERTLVGMLPGGILEKRVLELRRESLLHGLRRRDGEKKEEGNRGPHGWDSIPFANPMPSA